MIKFSGEKRDLQKTLLKFVLMFRNNFFFVKNFLLRGKMSFNVENENFENMLFNPFDSQNVLSDEIMIQLQISSTKNLKL